MPGTQELVIEQQSAATRAAEPEHPQELQPVMATSPVSAADQELSKGPVTAEEIAVAAYGLYVVGGYQDGHDLEHWLEAERLLRSRRSS